MPRQGGFKLDWKGDIVVRLAEEAITQIVADLGELAENLSKAELTPGHGYITGDLKGSIRLAQPGATFGETHGEQGGQRVLPVRRGHQYVLVLGSGMPYAMAIHQGWPYGYPGLRGSFAGYHFLTRGVEGMKGQITPIILRHRIR